jgi:hypothetical protein
MAFTGLAILSKQLVDFGWLKRGSSLQKKMKVFLLYDVNITQLHEIITYFVTGRGF